MAFRNIITTFFTILTFMTFGQFEDVKLNMDGDWHLLKSEQGVNINYKFEVCDQFDRDVAKYILKIENTEQVSKELEFSMKIFKNGDCENCARIDILYLSCRAKRLFVGADWP